MLFVCDALSNFISINFVYTVVQCPKRFLYAQPHLTPIAYINTIPACPLTTADTVPDSFSVFTSITVPVSERISSEYYFACLLVVILIKEINKGIVALK